MKFATGLTMMLVSLVLFGGGLSFALALLPIWAMMGVGASSLLMAGVYFVVVLSVFWTSALLVKLGWQSA